MKAEVFVCVILDDRSSRHVLGDAVETFVRREDAEHFIEKVRGDDPKLASTLRIEERELEAGGGAPCSDLAGAVITPVATFGGARSRRRSSLPSGWTIDHAAGGVL